MRASLLLATLVIGGVVATASVRASEPAKKSTPSAPAAKPTSKETKTPSTTTKDMKAPPATTDMKTSVTAKEHSGPAPKAAPATNKETATPVAHSSTTSNIEAAAAAAAAGARKPGTVTVAATTDAPKEESLEEIVARVKRRLAMERTPKRVASAPAAARTEPAPRVSLVWRPYVVWPDELTGTSVEPAPSDNDRVTLQWEADQR